MVRCPLAGVCELCGAFSSDVDDSWTVPNLGPFTDPYTGTCSVVGLGPGIAHAAWSTTRTNAHVYHHRFKKKFSYFGKKPLVPDVTM